MAQSMVKRSVSVARRRTTVRTVALAIILGNLIAFAAYRATRPERGRVGDPGELAAAGAAVPGGDSAVARAHRVAGLAALEAGDYATAISEFSLALRLGGTSSDAAELLRIAKELQDKRASPRTVKLPPEPEETRPKPASKPAPSRAKRPAPARAVARAEPPSPPAPGLLLVTSTPSGVLIEVDGKRVDFTPARIRVEPGPHTVALVQGDQRLYERRVEVQEDGVSSVDVDVSEKLRAPEPAPIEPPRPIAIEPEPSEEEEPAPPPTGAFPTAARPAPLPREVSGTGELHVVALGIYGEVWINGHSFGPPPLVAKGLAPGPAKVEIRVNGISRRSRTVQVHAGKRGVVHIR